VSKAARTPARERRPAGPTAGALPRAVAARAVTDVVVRHRRLETALEDASRRPRPDRRDAALAAEIAHGVLRWYPPLLSRVRGAMSRRPDDPVIEALCLVGLYQLDFLRVPPHAAVAATVAATALVGAGRARGFVNAVLRTLQRTAALPTDLDLPTAWATPGWLFDAVCSAWPEHWQAILAAGNERPPMVLRLDLRRVERARWLADAAGLGIVARAHPLADSAVVLAEASPVVALPGFAEGLVSVQDAAAQQAPGALALAPGLRVLDACAAPGGKAIHCLQVEPALGELLALDIDERRAALILEDLRRTGARASVRVTDATEPSSWWDGRPFDRVLLDAPCSGTGVIRRHPDIKLRRTVAQVDAAVALQDRLLDGLWPTVAPGGRLVYVTCSILPRENEERVAAFLDRHRDARCLPPEVAPGLARDCGVQYLPGVHESDGLYYAVLYREPRAAPAPGGA